MVTIVLCRATMDPIPRTKSMKKKRTEKSCGTAWNFDMASGYEMKAKPVPLRTTSRILSICRLCAKLPNIANIVIPPRRLVNVSSVVTIMASL